MDAREEALTCSGCGRVLTEEERPKKPDASELCPACAELDRQDQLFWSTMMTSWWP